MSSPLSYNLTAKINVPLLNRVFANLGVVAQELPRKACSKAARTAMLKYKRAAVNLIPIRTGALKKSMAVRVQTRTRRKSGIVYSVVGPRSGFKISSAKANREGATQIYFTSNRRRHKTYLHVAKGYGIIPSKYAHLVEFGHNSRSGGKVKAHSFMEVALHSVSPTAIAMIFASTLKEGLAACDFQNSRCSLPEPKKDEVISG